jgi:hypothetical protein
MAYAAIRSGTLKVRMVKDLPFYERAKRFHPKWQNVLKALPVVPFGP